MALTSARGSAESSINYYQDKRISSGNVHNPCKRRLGYVPPKDLRDRERTISAIWERSQLKTREKVYLVSGLVLTRACS